MVHCVYVHLFFCAPLLYTGVYVNSCLFTSPVYQSCVLQQMYTCSGVHYRQIHTEFTSTPRCVVQPWVWSQSLFLRETPTPGTYSENYEENFACTLFMVGLCNRADHYIFILFLSFFFLSFFLA